MAFEVVPTAAGRLHSDQYTKIIIINTPINLQSSLDSIYVQPHRYSSMPIRAERPARMHVAKFSVSIKN